MEPLKHMTGLTTAAGVRLTSLPLPLPPPNTHAHTQEYESLQSKPLAQLTSQDRQRLDDLQQQLQTAQQQLQAAQQQAQQAQLAAAAAQRKAELVATASVSGAGPAQQSTSNNKSSSSSSRLAYLISFQALLCHRLCAHCCCGGKQNL